MRVRATRHKHAHKPRTCACAATAFFFLLQEHAQGRQVFAPLTPASSVCYRRLSTSSTLALRVAWAWCTLDGHFLVLENPWTSISMVSFVFGRSFASCPVKLHIMCAMTSAPVTAMRRATELVMDRGIIAARYLRSRFPLDALAICCDWGGLAFSLLSDSAHPNPDSAPRGWYV